MGFGLPDMSQLIYKLSVNPDESRSAETPANGAAQLKGPVKAYSFDFGISLYQMKLRRLPDGNRRGHLEVRVIAYDDSGKPLNMTGHNGYLNLTPMAYQEALRTGVQLHEELDLPAKTSVHIRTGVYDLNSDNAGTLGVRLRTEAAE